MPIPAAVSIGLAGAGVAGQLLGSRKRPDVAGAIARLRASQPRGYLTPEDYRSAELTRGRITEGVQSAGKLAGYEIGRRFRARGMAGSPSEERSRARLEQETLLGAQHAGETSEEQLYNTGMSREAYGRQKDLAIFGTEIGQAIRESERQQAEQGAFWNSLNEFMPTIIGGLGTEGGVLNAQGRYDYPIGPTQVTEPGDVGGFNPTLTTPLRPRS